ncbi:uncharacterized protein LOC117567010 [Drosophila albomicans]|uniref:Uncharacterized protein LOC117567010 n=1 Tax=Drosophila albomicans TaxID=7291 RepID=A0A6P8Y052_DROAB|nr:uncharacterized protein LOC117567010 [Drosophila albomicans]
MNQNENFRLRGKGPCPAETTETQRSFGIPYRNKKLITRANRMEQFLWQEFFDEYKRQSSVKPDLGPDHTEYFVQYCKDKPVEDEERMEVRVNKYPLYCTSAITVWNHDGDVTKTFKTKYSITRPLAECSEKFGP